jgi:lipopolysaccharide export LptBFGC system permease protein LptF
MAIKNRKLKKKTNKKKKGKSTEKLNNLMLFAGLGCWVIATAFGAYVKWGGRGELVPWIGVISLLLLLVGVWLMLKASD